MCCARKRGGGENENTRLRVHMDTGEGREEHPHSSTSLRDAILEHCRREGCPLFVADRVADEVFEFLATRITHYSPDHEHQPQVTTLPFCPHTQTPFHSSLNYVRTRNHATRRPQPLLASIPQQQQKRISSRQTTTMEVARTKMVAWKTASSWVTWYERKHVYIHHHHPSHPTTISTLSFKNTLGLIHTVVLCLVIEQYVPSSTRSLSTIYSARAS
jgi:hypothetical protein